MTDARFPERWLNDRRIMRLSPRDFRSFVVALTYSVANKTDGRLDLADLEACPGFNLESIPALVSAGLWLELDRPGTWAMVEFIETQTTRAQLDALARKREAERIRQAEHRARIAAQRANSVSAGSEPVTRDVTRDVTANHSRTGQDRTGQALRSEHVPTNDDDQRERPLTPSQDSSSSRPAQVSRQTEPEPAEDDGWPEVRRPGSQLAHDDAPAVAPANQGGSGWDFAPDLY